MYSLIIGCKSSNIIEASMTESGSIGRSSSPTSSFTTGFCFFGGLSSSESESSTSPSVLYEYLRWNLENWHLHTKDIFGKTGPFAHYRFLHPSRSDLSQRPRIQVSIEVEAFARCSANSTTHIRGWTYSEISTAPFLSFWAVRTNTLIPSWVHIFFAKSWTYWWACFSANLDNHETEYNNRDASVLLLHRFRWWSLRPLPCHFSIFFPLLLC